MKSPEFEFNSLQHAVDDVRDSLENRQNPCIWPPAVPGRPRGVRARRCRARRALLHAKDLSRIQQKIYCPVDDAIIDLGELVRGYEVEKGRYVTFTDEELQNLEAGGEHTIEITEFIPLTEIDPVYFEEPSYLGCEPGAAKAYRLLADAMAQSGRVALGRYTMRGKEHLVVIRPYAKGLMLHTVYYADEVRSADEIDRRIRRVD